MAETPSTPLSSVEYEEIEAAVMETSRGRWFLAEFAKRNRHAETERLIASLARIERAVSARDVTPDPAVGVQRDLADIADKIARTRHDIARSVADAAGAGEAPVADKAFDDLVAAAELADTEAFDAAEQIQELAWSLRETAESAEVAGALDDLDRHAQDIYRASNRHALTTGRVRQLITVLRGIEGRIQALLGSDARGGRVAAPAQRPDAKLPAMRDDVVFVDSQTAMPTERRRPAPPALPAADRPPPEQRPAAPPPARVERTVDPRVEAFAAVDALSVEQKLALFV